MIGTFNTGDIISYAPRKWSGPTHLGVVVNFAEPAIVTVTPWPTDKRDPAPEPQVELISIESVQNCGGVLQLHPLYRRLYNHELERLGNVLQDYVDGLRPLPDNSAVLVTAVLENIGICPVVRGDRVRPLMRDLYTEGIVKHSLTLI